MGHCALQSSGRGDYRRRDEFYRATDMDDCVDVLQRRRLRIGQLYLVLIATGSALIAQPEHVLAISNTAIAFGAGSPSRGQLAPTPRRAMVPHRASATSAQNSISHIGPKQHQPHRPKTAAAPPD